MSTGKTSAQMDAEMRAAAINQREQPDDDQREESSEADHAINVTEQDKVRTWDHARKGRIRGVIIEDKDTFVTIRLVGDQTIRYVSRTLDPHHDDGGTIEVRKSLLTEVTDG